MVDRFSGFPFVARLISTTTRAVCEQLLHWFCDVGLPKRVKSDNGPQFRGPFGEFCTQYNIVHETSSPYNPRSNGQVEAGVKAIKNLLKKVGGSINDATFREALLMLRVTPRTDVHSPAFGFFGRSLRSRLPGSIPQASLEEFHDARVAVAEAAAERAGGHDLPILMVGQPVSVQDQKTKRWSLGGVIVKICESGRSYMIRSALGEFRRNRRYIRPAAVQGRNDDLDAMNENVEADPEIPLNAGALRRGNRIRKQFVTFEPK